MARSKTNAAGKNSFEKKTVDEVEAGGWRNPLEPKPLYRQLEQRIAFDGALVPTAVDVPDAGAADAQGSGPSSTEVSDSGNANSDADTATQTLVTELSQNAESIAPQANSTTVVFVDAAVSDPAIIAEAVPAGAEVFVLDATRDGLTQIADFLSNRSGIEAVHIVSHGEAGELRLGNATVNGQSIAGHHADELAAIGAALTADADILIYGCNFADDLAAVEAFAAATGADIAASNDDTGTAQRGGDWDLEVTTGAIEAAGIAAPNWDGILAPLTLSTTAPPTVDTTPIPVGGSTVWTNAGFIGGTAIDLRATVVSADPGVVVLALTIGDDPSIAIDTGGFGFGGSTAGTATIQWEIFEAGTGQSVIAIGSPEFTVSDIDGSGAPNTIETIAPELNGLQSYVVDPSTALSISAAGGILTASGTDDDSVVPGGPLRLSAAITFNWSDRSSWNISYTAERNADGRIFSHDGDGDFVFVNAVTTTLLGVDLDGNDSTASGTSYNGSFTEGGSAVPIVDSDVSISQHTALGTNLGSASITLTNAQPGDVLAVGALPAGITASIDTSVAGEITVTLTGNASIADYETALQAITFENTSDDPDTTNRQIQVSVTNTTFGTSSLAALSTISVLDVNDEPAGADNTISTGEDTSHTFTAADFGFTDVDNDNFQSVTIQPLTGNGTLTFGGVPVTTATTIPVANIGQLVYTPASDDNGSGVATLDFQVTDDGGTANPGDQDTDQTPNTITFDVTPVNDPPAGADNTITTNEDTSHTFTAADFGFTDVDNDNFQSVTIQPLTGNGTLTLGGVPVTAATTIPVANIGQLVYMPVSDDNGAGVAAFDFQVTDDGGTANPGDQDTDQTPNTVTFNVTPVNDPPIIDLNDDNTTSNLDHAVTFTEDGGAVSVTDVDADAIDPDDDKTELVINIAGVQDGANEILTIAGQTMPLNTAAVLTNVLIPGTTTSVNIVYSTVTGNLAVSESSSGILPQADLDLLLRGLTYENTSQNPTAGDRTLTFTAEDSTGATSAPAVATITVVPVNDEPTAVDDGPVSVTGGTTENIAVLGNDSDDDNDPLTVTHIIDPTNPGTPVAISVGNSVTLASGTTVALLANGTLDVTTPLTDTGPETFDYAISDGQGGADTATVTLDRASGNSPPVAQDDTDTVDEDAASTSGNVITGPGTDSDPDLHALTVTAANQGGNAITLGVPFTVSGGGELTLNGDGSYSFDPGTSYNGLDDGETEVETITYTVSDGFGGTDTATLEITVTGSNDAPVIIDPSNPGPDPENPIPADPNTIIPVQNVDDGEDFTTTPMIDVSQFAADPDSEPLTFTTTSPLPAGLTLNPDGTVTGIVDPSASQGGDDPVNNPGVYTVQVNVSDGDATSTVTLTIDVSNPPPVAVDDTATANEDGPDATGNVITDPVTGDADTAPDSDPLTITAANQAGNPITIGVPFTVSGGGELTLNSDGSYSFDPGASYNGLDDGETEIETITYTVSDGQGDTDTATLEITVTGSNDAPVIIDPSNPGPDPENPIPADPNTIIPVQNVNDGEDFTTTPMIDVSQFAADPDGEPLTFTTTSPLPTGLTLNPDGTVTGVIDPSASQGGDDPVNNPGVYTISVVVSDGDDTSTVTLTIDVSNPPPVAVDDTATANEDGPNATGNVITDPVTGDADAAPDSDPLTITTANQAGNPITIGTPFTVAGGGELTLNADGSYSFDPGTSYNGLDDGETEIETITYTVSDGQGGADTATLEVTVTGSNDAPVIIDPSNPGPDPENPIPADPNTIIPVQNVDDGEDFTTTPMIDVSQFAADPDGEPLTFTTTSPLPTGLTLNPDGTVTGIVDPSASQGGDDPVNNPGVYTVTVNVSDGDATSTVTLTIDVSNPPPVAVDDVATTRQDTAVTFSVLDNDHDTAPDSDPVSVVLASSPDGAVVVNADGTVRFTPAPGFFGTATITYVITDSDGATATAVATVEVEPQDGTPHGTPANIFAPFSDSGGQNPEGLSVKGAVVDAVNDMLLRSDQDLSGIKLLGDTDLTKGPILKAVNQANPLMGTGSIANGAAALDAVNEDIENRTHLSNAFRAAERTAGVIGPDTISGFSLKFGDLGTEQEVITIESLVNGDTLVLQIHPSDDLSALDIVRYDIQTIDGAPPPAWLDEVAPGTLMGKWPATTESLDLQVTVTLDDGTQLTRKVTVQTPTGEIYDFIDGRRADAPIPFPDQLTVRYALCDAELDALTRALAS